MPLLNTMPGAWPAQVLIATTSGRSSLPLPPRSLAGETPSDPLPRSGSGGAFPRPSKSFLSTVCELAAPEPPLSVAQDLRPGANRRTLKNAATSSATTMTAFPNGVSFMFSSPSAARRAARWPGNPSGVLSLGCSSRSGPAAQAGLQPSDELVHRRLHGGDEPFRLL